MKDIDGNEVEVGDLVKVLEIDQSLLKYGLDEFERPHHEAMLNNDYEIDEIVDSGRKVSVSIQWECPEGIATGGLYMLPEEFRLVRKNNNK